MIKILNHILTSGIHKSEYVILNKVKNLYVFFMNLVTDSSIPQNDDTLLLSIQLYKPTVQGIVCSRNKGSFIGA